MCYQCKNIHMPVIGNVEIKSKYKGKDNLLFLHLWKKVCEAYYNFGKIDEEVIIAWFYIKIY